MKKWFCRRKIAATRWDLIQFFMVLGSWLGLRNPLIHGHFLIGWHKCYASFMVRMRVRFSCVRSRYVLEIEQVLRCGFVMHVKSLQRFYFIKTCFVTLQNYTVSIQYYRDNRELVAWPSNSTVDIFHCSLSKYESQFL